MNRDSPDLEISEKGEVCWVQITRPQDRNSINSGLMAQIEGILYRLEGSGARALVFTGSGDTYFIGGADGIEMMGLEPEGGKDFSQRFQSVLDRMEMSPLIMVAAINGLCFGGGFEFAMACDLRVASREARIGLPEVKVGLIPGGGGTQRLPRLVGSGLAMEMILAGKLYSGGEAVDLGLVNRVVEAGNMEGGVKELLEPILKNPAYATSLAKRAVKAASHSSWREGLCREAELFSRCHNEAFFRELMKSQLRSGALTTSADLEEIISGGGS